MSGPQRLHSRDNISLAETGHPFRSLAEEKTILKKEAFSSTMRRPPTRESTAGAGFMEPQAGSEGHVLMAATDPVSETDLDEAFELGPEFGIQFLHSEFREHIWRYIKRVGRGFFNTHD